MEDGTMFVAEETLKSTGTAGQTGLWMLAIFMLALSAMAWLTIREASLYEKRAAIRNLRSLKRTRRVNIPERENLTAWSRAWLNLRVLVMGREFRDAVEPASTHTDAGYEFRLRREIDKLVGKQVYHGQKEQL
jgi:hypothetical protein